MKIYVSSLIAGLFLSSAIASTVLASDTSSNDAFAVKGTKISLVQAIAAAEHSIDGKASRAELEQYRDKWVYDVEVIKSDKVLDVKVDPMSGKILSSTNDAIDHDSDHDQED